MDRIKKILFHSIIITIIICYSCNEFGFVFLPIWAIALITFYVSLIVFIFIASLQKEESGL